MTSSNPHPAGSIAPQQKRSEKTRNRILGAVEKLVKTGRYNGATVQDIVQAAGCSTGAFYGRFSDKNAALLAVIDGRYEQLQARLSPVFEPENIAQNSLDTVLAAFIDAVFDHTASGVAFLRTTPVMSMGANDDDPFLARFRELNAQSAQWLEALYDRHADTITKRRPESAHMSLALIGGLCRDILLVGTKVSGVSVRDNLNAAGFKAEILRIVRGYLMFE